MRAATPSARRPSLPPRPGPGRSPSSAGRARRSWRALVTQACLPSPRDSPTAPTPPTGRSSRAPNQGRCSAADAAARQALALAEGRFGGGVRSICVHGDTAGAAALAAGVRDELVAARRRTAGVRMTPAFAAAGDRGALIELPDSAAALRVARALAGRADLVDVVPGHCTVLVTWAGDERPHDLEQLAASALASRLGARIGGERRDPGGLRRCRSRGGGAARGPLARGGGRAARRGRVRRRVHRVRARLRLSASAATNGSRCRGCRVRASAFRREASRSPVPTPGVYPRESPGGWRLIGRTSLALFDPQRRRRPHCSRAATASASSRL